ncbi:MAG: NAD(P)/FAD-dependent oxidoreductase [Deltaproteobacteria bacterium]|nr:NAD(P)/FAD-dependent oxidoreductase [Deltaproteobacteria bacterium]
MFDFDVAIVGASLSGSAAAIELAAVGRVALFDKSTFPRRKACGEGLSAIGYRTLQELGIAIPAQRLFGYRIAQGDRNVTVSSQDGAFGVERRVLDAMVLDRASRAEGITTCLGEKVRGIELRDDRVIVSTGASRVVARHVIIADGAQSLTAKRLDVPTRQARRPRFAASTECETTSTFEHVQILVRPDFEVYVTPTRPGSVNISFVGDRASLGRLVSPDCVRAELNLVGELVGADFVLMEDPLGVGCLGPLSRTPVFGRALLAGDACETLDPICGMGMTHALLSGRSAGASLANVFRGESSWCLAAEQYRQAERSLARRLRGYSRGIHACVAGLPRISLLRFADRSGIASRLQTCSVRGGGVYGSLLNTVGAL